MGATGRGQDVATMQPRRGHFATGCDSCRGVRCLRWRMGRGTLGVVRFGEGCRAGVLRGNRRRESMQMVGGVRAVTLGLL